MRQAGLEVLFTILAASTQRESAWRPRTRRLSYSPERLVSAQATNTGDGYLCEKDRPYPQRTIFDALLDAGHEYVRIYNVASRVEINK